MKKLSRFLLFAALLMGIGVAFQAGCSRQPTSQSVRVTYYYLPG